MHRRRQYNSQHASYHHLLCTARDGERERREYAKRTTAASLQARGRRESKHRVPSRRQGCHRQVAMVPGGKREDAPVHRKRLSRFRFKSL